jgi:hypothetical protein
MKTVVQFLVNNKGSAKTKNGLYTRSLRKIGVVDSRSDRAQSPKPKEHWLVEIVRENLSDDGNGCFILKPLERVDITPGSTLLHGDYEMSVVGDSVILTPHDDSKPWVMSDDAKVSILEETKTRSCVISHGGPLWPRRPPATSALSAEALKLKRALE